MAVLRRLLPTPDCIRLLIVPALVFIALATDRNYLADFWHHLARGRAMVEAGQLVNSDRFTFTVPGQPFQDVNWLTQLSYYYLHEIGGLDLVQTVNALTLAAALTWLVLVCRRLSGSMGISALVGVSVFFGLWQVLTIRPQTFSLLLFVVLFDVLERSERRPWLLALPPLLLALWANLHGAFPAGLMLIGCFLLAAAWRKPSSTPAAVARIKAALPWLACLAGSVVATLANPYGWKIYLYVGLTSNRAAIRRIDEWVPPTLDLWIGKAWLLSMIVLVGLVLANRLIGRRWPSGRALLLVLCFLPLACRSVRMVAWWLLVLAPLAAITLAELFPQTRTKEEDRKPSPAAGIVFALIALFMLTSLPGLQRCNPLLAGKSSDRIEHDLDTIHSHLTARVPTARIFSRFEWGEYLSWAAAPNHKVFMDGRIEIYPDDVWNHYAAITQGLPGWQDVLDHYRVDALLLDADYHARTGLLPQVEQSPHWQRVLQVRSAWLYVRSGERLAQTR